MRKRGSIMRAVIIICCLLAGSLASVEAQVPYFRSEKVIALSPDARVEKVFQDRSGFIWLGASDGLYRYNGVEFIPFYRLDNKHIEVTAIFEDKLGFLWIGYKDGAIYKLFQDKMEAFSPQEGLPEKAINDIIEDKSGNIWFATYGEGLYCYNKGRLYNFNTDDGVKDNYTYCLAIDKNGLVWAGTDGGIALCQMKGRNKITFGLTSEEGLPDNMVMALNADTNGIWIGTQSMGMCFYSYKTENIDVLPGSKNWNSGEILSMLSYKDKLWVNTGSNGVAIFNKKTGELVNFFNHGNCPIGARITSSFLDKEGNVWVSDHSENIYITNPGIQFYRNGPMGENIQAIWKDTKGNLWFSTGEKLYRKEGETGDIKMFPIHAISLYEDEFGYMWVGTFGKGVYRMNPVTGEKTLFTEADGLANGNVLSIDGRGREIWFATLGGVSKCTLPLNGGKGNTGIRFINYSKQQGLGTNYIYKIFIDSKGRVWFGTDGKGATLYENGVFKNYSVAAGLKSNIIYSITEDADHNIWFSSDGSGIYKYDGKRFVNYNKSDGISDLNISCLIADGYKNIIMMHKNGIDVMNVYTGQVLYHGSEAGIDDIDPGLNACFKDEDGDIWLGTKKGIIMYMPHNHMNHGWPVSRINHLYVFLKRPEGNNSKEFSYDQNHISFDYIGLWYHDPKEVIYRVKLENYDMEWSISRNHFITYPNLPPGKYTFKVQSSASQNFKGAPTVSYSFVIKPPFWNTLWFYFLCFSGAGSSLYYFVKNREKRLRLRERYEKDKVEFQFETLVSQVNPHFLFNSFNTLISIIERDPDTAVVYVEKLSDFYRDILLYREKSLILLEEELRLIERYFFLQQKRYKENLKLEIDVPEMYMTYNISPLTLQMLLENAIKHNIISKEKPLVIRIFMAEDDYLQVENNLQPKKKPEPSTGIGLQNIRQRYQLLDKKREVFVQKTENAFIVKIPLI